MKSQRLILKSLLVVILSLVSLLSYSQTPTDSLPGDPGAISVYTVQNMSFGSFAQGNTGGTIVISPSGSRSSTGTVVPFNGGNSFFNALFELDAPLGTIVSISAPSVTLTGSNGGSMNLVLGPSNPVTPFQTVVAQPARTQFSLGGTLTVGNSTASPPGSYSGTFYITFNQE